MATIVLINGAVRIFNSGVGDLMEAHNTSVTNLNNELVTKLPLAGGTMTGDINMGAHKIIGLAAPTAGDEPARKTDIDGKVNLTGNETIAGVKTFSSSPVVPAATWGKGSMKSGRLPLMIFGVCKSGTTYMRLSDVAASHAFRMFRPGCLTGLTLQGADTAALRTMAYLDAGGPADGRFIANDRIEFYRNTNTGVCYPRINGTNVLNLGLDDGSSNVDDMFIQIEFILDD